MSKQTEASISNNPEPQNDIRTLIPNFKEPGIKWRFAQLSYRSARLFHGRGVAS